MCKEYYIHHDLVIKAPVETVCETITNPSQLTRLAMKRILECLGKFLTTWKITLKYFRKKPLTTLWDL